MPLTFVVDFTRPLVRAHGVGALTLNDFRDAVSDLTQMGAATFPRFIDLREATVHVSSADIQRYVTFKTNHIRVHQAVRIANVTTDLATYGMLRMYQMMIADYEPGYGVFWTLPEAMEWLHITPDIVREQGA